MVQYLYHKLVQNTFWVFKMDTNIDQSSYSGIYLDNEKK